MSAPEDAPRPKRGRPAAAPGEGRTESIEIRATPAEKAKFAAVGGPAWFRAVLKRAKPKP